MRTSTSFKYSTHLPVLMAAMKRTDGDVLELGPGIFSTPILHWLCKTQDRYLLTVESNKEWYNYCKYFDSPRHQSLFVDDFYFARWAISKPWDVVLVDHSPAERRVREITMLKDLAKYIVVHDADEETDNEYHFSTIYPLFKYRYNLTEVKPATVLLSNLADLTDFTIYK